MTRPPTYWPLETKHLHSCYRHVSARTHKVVAGHAGGGVGWEPSVVGLSGGSPHRGAGPFILAPKPVTEPAASESSCSQNLRHSEKCLETPKSFG